MLISFRTLLPWLIPVLFTLHNAEEVLTVRSHLPALRNAMPARLREIVGEYTVFQFAVLVAALTLAAWAVAFFGNLGAAGSGGAYALLALQATLLVNVISHVVGAIALRGYVPGLVTAVLVNLPYSWLVFSTAWSEHWYPAWALLALAPLALALHGPVLIGLLRLAILLPKG